jgi:sigma-B regulation protein RsbU (phosphoserine phosphatase)
VIFFVLLMMELRDKLDLKGDLEIAREIQFGLVPSEPVVRDAFSICARMRPANTVGGDYYDIIELSADSVGVVVGDVAGKGMPAALLMAMLQGSLRTLITAGFRGGLLIGKLNDYLVANIPPNSLVTLFYGELNTRSGELKYVNAGHNAPFVLRQAGSERLPSTGTVLGFFAGLPYEVSCTALNAGDRLLLFTDGLSEAFNPAEEEYGEARIQAFLEANRDLQDTEVIDGLIQNVLAFCRGSRPGDDMTVMSVARRS